jgi:hypothetical protein
MELWLPSRRLPWLPFPSRQHPVPISSHGRTPAPLASGTVTGVSKLPRSLAPGSPLAKSPSPISPSQPVRSAAVVAGRAPPYRSHHVLPVRCICITAYLARSSQLIRLLATAVHPLFVFSIAGQRPAPPSPSTTSLLHADWGLVAPHLSDGEPVYQLISEMWPLSRVRELWL